MKCAHPLNRPKVILPRYKSGAIGIGMGIACLESGLQKNKTIL
jgi:hypothetical protein